MTLTDALRRFLADGASLSKPLLVGLSGGVDSIVLLHLLVSWGRAPIIAAHLDHGWRPESAEEASRLLTWAESLGVACHLRCAEPMVGNLEEAGRKARFAFFKELCAQEGCQALLLAHHAGDQAETIAKRFLEGASFSPLAGMRPVTCIDGMAVWRPLLGVTRRAIEEYAADHGLQPIDDPCNRDRRFLRPRLRQELLPQLSAQLGKEVSGNLCRFGSRMALLSDYFEERLGSLPWQLGWLGEWIESKLHPVEWEFLLRKTLRERNLSFSAQEIDLMVNRLVLQKGSLQFEKAEQLIAVDRGRLFFLHRERLNSLVSGNWELEVGESDASSSWKSLWQRHLAVRVPEGSYRLDFAKMSTPLTGRKSLGEWLTRRSVPSFLRERVPVLWLGDRIVADFLSGGYFGEGQTVSIFLRDAL